MCNVAWGNSEKFRNEFFNYLSTINITGNEIMIIKAILNIIMVWLMLLTVAIAEETKIDTEVKELSGISIIGNKEAPKSLYIVPWHNSEVGVATSLNSGLLDDSMRPLDKEVFLRELDFYELSHGIK